MGLYDVIDEITERRATKTETGDTRAYGVMVGIVARNYHPDMGGRVCVTIPTRDVMANELKWARMAMPSSGNKWGHYFLPEVGDQVLLAFENGNLERPYVIGCVPKDNNQFLTGSVDSTNQYKRIVTRHGSTITFEDSNMATDGTKDKITIATPKEAHMIVLDNAGKSITMSDKSGKNSVEISTAEGAGAVTIKAETDITLKIGDNLKLTMNGSSGTISIKAQQINIDAASGFKAVTSGAFNIEGAQIKEKSSATHTIESSGSVQIMGAPIKMG